MEEQEPEATEKTIGVDAMASERKPADVSTGVMSAAPHASG